ncbi:MAG: DUF4159 domain-containing protein [Chthoniobacterales bacterium]
MAAITQNNALREFWYRLSKSQFFVASLLFHLLLVIFFGGKAIFDNIKDEPDMIASEAGQFVSSDPNPAPPAPPAQPQQTKPQFNVTPTQTAAAPAGLTAITTATSAATSFSMPTTMTMAPSRSNTITSIETVAPSMPSPANASALSKEAKAAIASFTGGWSQGASGGGGGSLKNRKFKFTAYVAKYSGGDWASTVWRDGTRIYGGSLPNLLYVMKTQSQDKIDATPDPEAIDLASDKIFTVKPPFIFFTGHRDFVLTDKEVENLQRYIRLGGCVWGDSSLPGQRSRFDIAFRREMKRVIPDLDKQFEPLPRDHDIFTKGYYKEIISVPPGINGYQEPVYALKYNGEIAVLYTANDYGDMWQIGMDSRWQVDTRRDKGYRYVALNITLWNHRGDYFRGMEPDKLANSFRFGTNVVIHLLTRWESKVRSIGTL